MLVTVKLANYSLTRKDIEQAYSLQLSWSGATSQCEPKALDLQRAHLFNNLTWTEKVNC